jgi:hypothetical protein
MKNIKTFNPILLARNAIGAAFIMTLLNMILVAISILPIFPLSLIVPTSIVSMIRTIPVEIMKALTTPDLVLAFRVFWGFIALIMIGLLLYSYQRSAKKQKAIKIGFGVVVLDTLVLLLGFNWSLSFFIEVAYHLFLIYYIFKGIKALKGTAHV